MQARPIRMPSWPVLVPLLLVAACGGGDTSTATAEGMSANQADAFARSVSRAASISMNAAFLRLEAARLDAADGISCTPTSCVINQSLSGRLTCTAGGAINVTGNVSGTINSTGSGLIQISATETITDWLCLPPLVVNGDPYVSLVGTFSFLNGQPSTQQHVGIDGGVKWTGAGAGSCGIHLDTNFDRSGTGHTTGSVCGHAVDVTYP